jgi:hypothetical protein
MLIILFLGRFRSSYRSIQRTYDSQPYSGSERDLILSTTIRSSIWPNDTWQHSQTIDSSLNSHLFSFRYRVSCSTHFYGSQCSRFCSPLSRHSRCDPTTGDLVCDQGWTGIDCHEGKFQLNTNENIHAADTMSVFLL